jgi:hypothetical protein
MLLGDILQVDLLPLDVVVGRSESNNGLCLCARNFSDFLEIGVSESLEKFEVLGGERERKIRQTRAIA